MKHTILNIAFAGALLAGATSCSDYLDTNSVSKTDGDFVFSNMTTARAAMNGAYEQWHNAIGSYIFGDGLFYALDIAGSDIMRHPEKFANQLPRHEPENFYLNGTAAAAYNPITYGKEAPSSPYSVLFACIGKANAITSAIEEMDGYANMMAQTGATELSQLYGEAVCLRASAYRELIKYYGDVPYQTKMGEAATGLAPRDLIYDKTIAELMRVAPIMNAVKADNKNRFSSTYAYALAGRMALEAAGYQTRRGDLNYTNGKGEALTFEKMGTENNGATYGRRSDYKDLYAIAKDAFVACTKNLGTVTFGANYSDFFVQLHQDDNSYADESIFEEPFAQGNGNSPRSYSLGRPSSGGSSNAYPCKAYGQGRINPAFYYGMFDPNDKRRDISCTVTGSDGKGYEKLISFNPNSKADGGGISCNKFDECRQANPWVSKQRQCGINAPYLRISEVYLGLAEAYQVLGESGKADIYYNYTHVRAGLPAKSNVTFEEIIDERGFEFAGEGDRRWTLIRTGLLPKKAKEIKELTALMMKGLNDDGSYIFANGNVISNVIYTKMVDPTAEPYKLGSRLTEECTDKTNPVLYPGWRGQHDWDKINGFTAYEKNPKSNVAIKGLFEKLSAEEVAALLADGYVATDWGKTLLANEAEYSDYLFREYDYVKAPIYLFPFSTNAVATGGFTNGYGFGNAW